MLKFYRNRIIHNTLVIVSNSSGIKFGSAGDNRNVPSSAKYIRASSISFLAGIAQEVY